MTRAEARQNLVALGIDEPTDAQVTNYLNQFHAHPEPEPQPAPQPDPIADPSVQSNPEELESLREQIANLQRENIQKDIKAYAAEKGLTGDQAVSVLAGFKDDLDLAKTAIDSMSEIITAKETAAAQAKEKEIANGSTPPGNGGTGSNSSDTKTEAEKIAAGLIENQNTKNDILKHYI